MSALALDAEALYQELLRNGVMETVRPARA